MARKAYGLHATQVDTNTYPDDGSSPVGSNEWNEALDPAGMLGFTPATANSSTIIIASGVATITDSVTVIAAESSTSDTLQKLALDNTNEYDLVYLFADTGDTITLEHGDLNANGEISTVSGSNETLSTTVPTILMRKGNYWYGYGGGVVNAVSDIGDVTISGIASGELLKWNGSAWINQTLAESGVAASGAKLSDFAATSSSELAGTISDETGSGALAFATSPTLVTPALGTPASGVLTNCTALPAAQVAQGTMASGMVLVAPALGTPASGVATNLTGTAANLTAGAVTTNANLTGDVTSSGNATTIAAGAVDIAMLSASGTAGSGTFLRGDNSWTAVTTYSAPTIGSTSIASGSTNATIAGLTLTSPVLNTGVSGSALLDSDTMSGTSATTVSSSESIKAYVDSSVAANVTLKGTYNASTDDPSLDDGSPIAGIVAGDHYIVSVAGTFFSEVLQVGDSIIAKQDSPTTFAHWITVNSNIVTPIVGANIADNAIDSDHYTDGSVDLAHLSADSVDGTKIADDAIDSEHYAAGSIDTAHIANLQITTGLIAADAVTAAKLADDAVVTANIVDLNVTTAKIAADAVTGAKIADDTLDSEHYAAGSVDLEHMSSQSVDEDNLHISNAGSNGQFLSKQSGDTGGLTWATPSGSFVATATDDLDLQGLHDIEDLQRLCLEIQSSSFDSDSTNNDDRTDEVELYARQIDSNNDGIFCRVKKNGSNVYLQIV